ncbi:MAG: 50S ribosomal protein L19 [Candidatus Uhrbacteria bacterium]
MSDELQKDQQEDAVTEPTTVPNEETTSTESAELDVTTEVVVKPETEATPATPETESEVVASVSSTESIPEPAVEEETTAPTWDPKPGQVVRVHLRIKETTKKGLEKERLQVFEGMVIARRHGNEPGATFTVRKDAKGFGVERIFPIHAPTIAKVEVVKQVRVRRAKLHHLRGKFKKKLKEITKA